jgi:hypothetical protein
MHRNFIEMSALPTEKPKNIENETLPAPSFYLLVWTIRNSDLRDTDFTQMKWKMVPKVYSFHIVDFSYYFFGRVVTSRFH